MHWVNLEIDRGFIHRAKTTAMRGPHTTEWMGWTSQMIRRTSMLMNPKYIVLLECVDRVDATLGCIGCALILCSHPDSTKMLVSTVEAIETQ